MKFKLINQRIEQLFTHRGRRYFRITSFNKTDNSTTTKWFQSVLFGAYFNAKTDVQCTLLVATQLENDYNKWLQRESLANIQKQAKLQERKNGKS